MEQSRAPLRVLLSAPRGFCAGVDRAIQIVEKALEKYGPPVYVRHEIVHNKFVVESLKARGAVFVEELADIPDATRPVVFSAHGVPRSVPDEAEKRALFVLDATCPLVTKVHKEAAQHHRLGRTVILIGHAGHPEVVGTMGQLPPFAVRLVETVEDVERLDFSPSTPLAYCTQTTLSLDDAAEIVSALRRKYPAILAPGKSDICYATTNRQEAVKAIAPDVQVLFVIGSPNSSNSNRLVEVAKSAGCPACFLIGRATDIPWDSLSGVSTLGLTAGASAPETLVEEVLRALSERRAVKVEERALTREDTVFNIPRVLREDAEAV